MSLFAAPVAAAREHRRQLERRLTQLGKDLDGLRRQQAEVESEWARIEKWLREGGHRVASWVEGRWRRGRKRYRRLIQQTEAAIADTERQRDDLDFWILTKEETWGRVDQALLEDQVREIHRMAKELSVLLLGRPAKIVFDLEDDAPLGSVRIHGYRSGKREIHLSAEILGHQPEHVLDLYRALILHELGHLLLHLRRSDDGYRAVRKAMRQKITTEPSFFSIFNILLDEQLERLLRDRRVAWRRSFSRLEFYCRQIRTADLTKQLARHLAVEDWRTLTLQPWVDEGLIKLYGGGSEQRATILSGAMLHEELGFSRLRALYVAIRHPIPRATIDQGWLLDCLEMIPPDFTALDLLGVHALAARMWRRIFAGSSFVTIQLGTELVEVPGRPRPGHHRLITVTVVPKRRPRRGGGAEQEVDRSRHTTEPAPNPEGEPLPPVDVERQRRRVRMSSPPRTIRGRRSSRVKSSWRGSGAAPRPWPEPSGGSREPGRVPETAGQALQRKLRTRHLSAKERIRLRKAAEAEARAEQERSRESAAEEATVSPVVAPSPPGDGALRPIENRLASPPQPWSGASASEAVAQGLNELLEKITAELAKQRSRLLPQRRITATEGQVSDFRNTDDDSRYPPFESVVELLADGARTRRLVREVRPLVPVLLPHLTYLDDDRRVDERLASGRRVMASRLKAFAVSRDPRVFRDQRFHRVPFFEQVAVAVLVDTSASMAAEGRLDRARQLAVLLAETLKECPAVATVLIAFNQHLYLCGDHERHALASLEPAGKTNEAAALDHARRQLGTLPRRRKVVVVLSDGLPTSCSVAASQAVVRDMERGDRFRVLHGAVGGEPHPAYHRSVDLTAPVSPGLVSRFGRALTGVLA